MRRFSPDTLKLGTAVVILGAASLTGWMGLVAVVASGRLQQAPGFWADLLAMACGNLLLSAIVGLLAWVLADQFRAAPPVAA